MPAPISGRVVAAGSAVSPGGDTGLTGPVGPIAVSTDSGNIATLGSDNLVLVPQSQLWSMRLRSFNAVGNPNFEVDQRQVGNTGGLNGGFIDRWLSVRTGMTAATGTIQQTPAIPPDLCIPGTSFRISRMFLRVSLSTQATTLASGDQLYLHHELEGPSWRELSNDVHSLSLLVRTSVAGLKFGVTLRDPPTASQSLSKLCTIPTANTWTLIQLPNLPLWPSGNFQAAPGNIGYRIDIALAAGSASIVPANDTWQSGNFVGAVGQSNFAASPVTSTFDVGFVQHEPGPICTTLIDKPFQQNYDECLRYFQKSYSYSEAVGTAGTNGMIRLYVPAGGANPIGQVRFPVIMAKAPTITGYSQNNGAVNNVWDATNAANRAISGAISGGDSGFNGFTVTGGLTTIWQVLYGFTADTGW